MEDYASIFFVATSLWAAMIIYLIYLHHRIASLEKSMARLKEE